MAPTWLITGCSSGFGYALAKTVLSKGHNVIATSRNPSKTPDLVSNINSSEQGKWIGLDVTANASEIKQTISEAENLFGGIDILVNNAGYSVLGATEDIEEAASKTMFETNYWGPLRVIKAVLPSMRARKNGTIVNVSSVAGLNAMPTASMYAGSKWALEALSEALSMEVSSFNIRVLIVEPGAFRTRFLTSTSTSYTPVSDAYKGTVVEEICNRFVSMDGKQTGDTEKGVQRMFDVITGTGVGEGKTHLLRLPLGQDCIDRTTAQMEKVKKNFAEMHEIAASTAIED